MDKLNDVAVIKIDAHNLPSVPWGDSTKLRPGQTVLAFGNPFGNFPFTVTRGIVSGLNRPNPYRDDPRKPGDFIQTDAAINPGNSGGPLVDAHGEVVGINTFIISGSGSFAGAGFAIPSQIVRASAESIIKNGTVHHGYLGIGMNDVTPDNAGFFNLPDATGAIVSEVTPDSPAGRAGLKSGDVLRELNGKKIDNGSALQVAVSETSPGTPSSWAFCATASPRPSTSPSASSTTRRAKRPATPDPASSAASSAWPWPISRPTCASSSTFPSACMARPLRACAPAARPTMRASLPAT